jgi:hypothetical protein
VLAALFGGGGQQQQQVGWTTVGEEEGRSCLVLFGTKTPLCVGGDSGSAAGAGGGRSGGAEGAGGGGGVPASSLATGALSLGTASGGSQSTAPPSPGLASWDCNSPFGACGLENVAI